jgi:hypothetical protein
VILEREHQHRKDTARLSEAANGELAGEDDSELEETDRSAESSTRIDDEDTGKVESDNEPTAGLPGDHAAHTPNDE